MEKAILNKYEKLIYKVISNYSWYPSFEDLLQAGRLGLNKAFEKYDSTKNTKLSTFAMFYIEGEIKKQIRDDKNIKVSRNLKSIIYKITKAKIILNQTLMKEPTPKEISLYLGIPLKHIETALQINETTLSLDMPVTPNGDIHLHEIIASPQTKKVSRIDFQRAHQTLTESEKELLFERYYQEKTQSEVAKIRNTNQVKVSRDEKIALTKLRDKLVA